MKEWTCLFITVFVSSSVMAQSDESAATREAITRYLESKHTDLSMMADDVVFTNMATGETYAGREAIGEMLHYVYHIAFDATAELRNLIVGHNRAVLEAEIVGRHIGEFAGIAATHKDVRIPLCVVYDFDNGKITHGRIYFEVPALMAQIR
jgi:predicted ester cyclase